MPYLRKDWDKKKMRDKYELLRTNRGFLIASINYNTMRFTTKVLSCKLLRKMRPTECTAETVELAEQCMVRLLFNWS